jgi:hypothetical protein
LIAGRMGESETDPSGMAVTTAPAGQA